MYLISHLPKLNEDLMLLSKFYWAFGLYYS